MNQLYRKRGFWHRYPRQMMVVECRAYGVGLWGVEIEGMITGITTKMARRANQLDKAACRWR